MTVPADLPKTTCVFESVSLRSPADFAASPMYCVNFATTTEPMIPAIGTAISLTLSKNRPSFCLALARPESSVESLARMSTNASASLNAICHCPRAALASFVELNVWVPGIGGLPSCWAFRSCASVSRPISS